MLEKIKNFIRLTNNFLFLLIICITFSMITIKLKSFKINQILRKYEENIIKLKDEEEELNIIFSFLTTPERLNQIFVELKNKYFIDENIMVKQQIKDFQTMNLYFASKTNNYNLNKSFAKNEFRK